MSSQMDFQKKLWKVALYGISFINCPSMLTKKVEVRIWQLAVFGCLLKNGGRFGSMPSLKELKF